VHGQRKACERPPSTRADLMLQPRVQELDDVAQREDSSDRLGARGGHASCSRHDRDARRADPGAREIELA